MNEGLRNMSRVLHPPLAEILTIDPVQTPLAIDRSEAGRGETSSLGRDLMTFAKLRTRTDRRRDAQGDRGEQATSGQEATPVTVDPTVGPLICGTASYVDGTYVWTDYAYDDTGASACRAGRRRGGVRRGRGEHRRPHPVAAPAHRRRFADPRRAADAERSVGSGARGRLRQRRRPRHRCGEPAREDAGAPNRRSGSSGS